MTLSIHRPFAWPWARRTRAAAVAISRAPKIVVLTSSYPRHDGDYAGRFVADAVAQIRGRGLEVEVVHPRLDGNGGGLVAMLRRRPWRIMGLFFTLVLELRRAARDADLVHAHWLASAAVARLAGKPFVVTLHGTGSAGALSDLSLATKVPWLVRFLLRPARAVICVSAPLTEAMHAIGIEHARHIPNGVAIPVAGDDTDGHFILFAGRLAEEKGIPELMEATRGLPLVVAGDGPLRGLVPDALGFIPHDELEELYRHASVVVLPSHREGLPLCVLEAMAHGRPVVATNVGGIPQLVEDGRTGYLVEPGDSDALRGALVRLLEDAQLRATMGAAGRERVATTCSWAQVTDQTLAAYGLAA
jgi:glycosyltransferase involved in cell wall biosynthesis